MTSVCYFVSGGVCTCSYVVCDAEPDGHREVWAVKFQQGHHRRALQAVVAWIADQRLSFRPCDAVRFIASCPPLRGAYHLCAPADATDPKEDSA